MHVDGFFVGFLPGEKYRGLDLGGGAGGVIGGGQSQGVHGVNCGGGSLTFSLLIVKGL